MWMSLPCLCMPISSREPHGIAVLAALMHCCFSFWGSPLTCAQCDTWCGCCRLLVCASSSTEARWHHASWERPRTAASACVVSALKCAQCDTWYGCHRPTCVPQKAPWHCLSWQRPRTAFKLVWIPFVCSARCDAWCGCRRPACVWQSPSEHLGMPLSSDLPWLTWPLMPPCSITDSAL